MYLIKAGMKGKVKEDSVKYRMLLTTGALVASLLLVFSAHARELEYRGEGEIHIRVQPGEPTQVRFPGKIAGGFRKRQSALSLDRKESDLILFSNEGISEEGEALIVRLEDGRSYPVRVQRASEEFPRDPQLRIFDKRSSSIFDEEEEEELAPGESPKFDKKKPNTVSGFMRELVLATEFGKDKIPGYRTTDRYRGETVLNDGTMKATVDRIFVGPSLWGYVIDASNELDVSQRVNPATFRLDGTRAISMTNWELSGKPLNIEQQIAGKHKTKVYVITKAKKK
ncbi:MAG: hypothetical protein KDD70_02490 [Bdellovibrionales bacterium]|nr:hypothetical protein [Bdellovibrionales bacterium]